MKLVLGITIGIIGLVFFAVMTCLDEAYHFFTGKRIQFL